MKTAKMQDMVRGWFVGSFEPSVYRTDVCEAAYKTYQQGDRESAHMHKIATEITLVAKGKIKMFDTIFTAGDIIVVEPGDVTSFDALEDCATVVLKFPGVLGDKYVLEDGISC